MRLMLVLVSAMLLGCGSDNPNSSFQSVAGSYELVSFSFSIGGAPPVNFTPPEVIGSISLTTSGNYTIAMATTLSNVPNTSGEGTYLYTDPLIVLDQGTPGERSARLAGTQLTFIFSDASIQFTMVFTKS